MQEADTFLDRKFEKVQKLLEGYDYSLPFHTYFKKQTQIHSEWGAKDRKFYRHASYSWFRLSAYHQDIILEKHFFAIAYVLVEGAECWVEQVHNWIANNLDALKWKTILTQKIKDKVVAGHRFPLQSKISKKVNTNKLLLSVLQKPATWFFPLHKKKINDLELGKIQSEGFVPEFGGWYGLRQSSLPAELEKKGKIQIQDKGSRDTINSIRQYVNGNVWDACCGSGGKTLALKSIGCNANYYASDIRGTAVLNLQNRMQAAGYKQPFMATNDMLVDIEKITFFDGNTYKNITKGFFDVVVVDAPCSGSGTWSRNPENIHAWKANSLDSFVNRQRQILTNSAKWVKSGGILIYITCSVFYDENEGMINDYLNTFHHNLITEEYIEGYNQMSDNYYIAVVRI